VHLSGFPVTGHRRDDALEGAMDAVRRLTSLGRAARETKNIRVRQPLSAMQVALPARYRGPVFDELLGLLQSEVNVRAVSPVASDADLVRLKAKPNFRALGRKFGKRTQEAAAAVAKLGIEDLRALETGQVVRVEVGDGNGGMLSVEVGADEVQVEREVTSEWLVQSDGPYVVALDPDITDELRAEGLAREVVNRVQRMRKDAGYEFTTRIRLWVAGEEQVQRAVREHAAFIRDETLARELDVGGRAGTPDLEQQVDLDGVTAVLGVQRHGGE
jgi:isoleucyl-tRNA synthetase